MGTNYYLRRDFCPCCGQPRDEKHIGKQSCGWRFLAHAYDGIKTFDDYCLFLREGIIHDEYGRHYTFKDMYKIISENSGCKSNPDTNSWARCDYTTDDFC